MESLPETSFLEILEYVEAVDLAKCTPCRAWAQAAPASACARLAAVRFNQTYLPQHCWVRSLRAYEELCGAVGPMPARTWRDEWPGLEYKREFHCVLTTPEISLKYVLPSAEFKYKVGWPTDIAQGHTLIMTKFKAVLGEGIKRQSDQFAASSHLVSSALRCRACTEPVAPPAYNDLDGPYGLRRADPGWAAIASADVGYSFKTKTPLEASACGACLTQHGFSAPIIDVKGRSDDVQYQPQDSDVVCFVSRQADGSGFHSLVRTASTKHERQYDLPPLATITLLNVQEPHTWLTAFEADQGPNFYVNRRLYTVAVTFL